MKQTYSIFLSLLIAILAISGCRKDKSQDAQIQPGAANKTPVTITIVYAVGDQVSTDLMHERVENYMKNNPHVTIVEKLSNEGAYLDAIRTLDAVGELPDLIEMRDTPLFVRAGKLGELPADITRLFETTLPFDGKVYTVPISESYPTGIVYSKHIFTQLGIKAEDIKTYNDFFLVCEKIKSAGIAPIVVGGADIWHIGFWWGYFWQQEVAVKDPDWIAHRYEDKVHFTDPEVRVAMTGLTELFRKGYIEKGWASTGEGQCPSILVSGQAAMYYIGPFAFQQIMEADPGFEFGFFAIPDKNGKINVMGGPTPQGWAINAETQKDSAKAEVVYDFIRYFFSKDVYTEFLTKSNFISSLKEKYSYQTNEQFQEVLRIAATADNKQLNWNQKPGPNELPPNFRNFCYKLVSEWFLGVSAIDAGLRTMDQEWANATKDFNPVKNPQ
jgi:raffinose/stachyose/melibiose transport system substrate-binding protein